MRELIIPKHYFKSLSDWTVANYTSKGFQDLNGLKLNVAHETGKCDVTWIDDYNFICHQTTGNFGDYFSIKALPSKATEVSAVFDYRFANETEAQNWLSWVKNTPVGATGDPLPDIKDKVRYGNHVFVLFQGTVPTSGATLAIDLNGSLAPSAEQCPYIQCRFFRTDLLTSTHLKPIAVGDTLGLVYWDGIACNEYEASFNITTTKTTPEGATYQWLTARDCAEDNGTLTLLNLAGPRETILAKAGTINLAEYNIHINSIQTSGQPCLKDHLWHVI